MSEEQAAAFERLINALQTALVTAQLVHQQSHDLTDDAARLLNAVQRASQAAHEFRPTDGQTGGAH